MPFVLPEYDVPFERFVHEAVSELARQRSPLLAQIPRETVSGASGSVVDQRDGDPLELTSEPVEYGYSMNAEAVREGDFDAFMVQLDSASDELAEGLVGLLVSSMTKITDYTGQKVDAGGEFSVEVVYEAYEQMEWALGDDGEICIPQMVMHPDLAKRVAELPPQTDEQKVRFEALKARKNEEALARRRSRRLS
jgi:hypothetical protein